LDPQNGWAIQTLARLYWKRDEYGEACRLFKAGAAADPLNEDVRV
jgi:hypothetical protein